MERTILNGRRVRFGHLQRKDVYKRQAHGKMTEEELNPVWQHLLNGEIDILVCTTLIETGIDVRNCNTLII